MGKHFVGSQRVLVDEEFDYLFDSWQWHLHPAGKTTYVRGYPKGMRKRGLFYLHRVIMTPPKWQETDHLNGNGLDNRCCNLRLCTRSQNNANRHHVQSETGIKGVHFESWTGRWRAEISRSGMRYRLGRFDTQAEAAEAYEVKAKELFGSFARSSVRVVE